MQVRIHSRNVEALRRRVLAFREALRLHDLVLATTEEEQARCTSECFNWTAADALEFWLVEMAPHTRTCLVTDLWLLVGAYAVSPIPICESFTQDFIAVVFPVRSQRGLQLWREQATCAQQILYTRDGYVYRAVDYARRGAFAEALVDANRAMECQKRYTHALMAKGEALKGLNDHAGTLQSLRRSFYVCPSSGRCHPVFHGRHSRFEESRRHFLLR